jgi:hypothetical protein
MLFRPLCPIQGGCKETPSGMRAGGLKFSGEKASFRESIWMRLVRRLERRFMERTPASIRHRAI